MEQPLVTICLLVFNSEALVRRALESAVGQTYGNIEIVVSDDASTDRTGRIVLEYASRDPRIKYFRNEKNLGPNRNYFRILQLARGEFVQFLAHDDWLDRNLVEEKVSIFTRFPNVALVFSRVHTYGFDENQNLVLKEKIEKRSGLYPSSYAIRSFYRKPGLFGVSCMARTRDLLTAYPQEIPDKYGYDFFYEYAVKDTLTSLNILSRYPYMYYTDKTCYYALDHSSNHSKTCWPATRTDISECIKFFHATRIAMENFFSEKARDRFFNYRVFTGSEMLVTVFRDVARLGFKSFRWKQFLRFFEGYSLPQFMAVGAYTVPHGATRVLKWGVRKLWKNATIH